MSERVRSEGFRLLFLRLQRLNGLLSNGAPVNMIANECGLIGRVERMLDPDGWAERAGKRILDGQKRMLGICSEEGCELDAADDLEMCEAHDRAAASMVFEDASDYPSAS